MTRLLKLVAFIALSVIWVPVILLWWSWKVLAQQFMMEGP